MAAGIGSWWTRWAWGVATLCVLLPRADAVGQGVIRARDLTDQHIGMAIDVLVEELYRQQDPTRFWDPTNKEIGPKSIGFKEMVGQRPGWTALTVLALLHAGESYQDPRLGPALKYLKNTESNGTYAIAAKTLVWAMLPSDRFHGALQADARRLMNGFLANVEVAEQLAADNTYTDRRIPVRGGWDYRCSAHDWFMPDNSNTQFAALALWMANQRGVATERRIWKILEEHFVATQRDDGGWPYRDWYIPPQSTGSMTTSGLAVLFITQDLLHARDYVDLRSGEDGEQEKAIARGLDWLGTHFSPKQNPGGGHYYYYYMYGVERVGLASGWRRFGKHDWFREGAAQVIQNLCIWDPLAGTMSARRLPPRNPRHSVAHQFGLLFLSRGRVPIAINKLRLGDSTRWNNRPRDVANLTRWISDKTEKALNWQILDIDRPAHEWLSAPLVYLATDEVLPWVDVTIKETDQYVQAWTEWERRPATDIDVDVEEPRRPGGPELEAIKKYLDLGGMILAVKEGTTLRTAKSIERAGRLMYPHYEWRNVERQGWAYTMLFQLPDGKPHLRVLSNGVRDLIILAPSDLSRELQSRPGKRPLVRRVAANIYLYASERNRPRPRLAPHAFRSTVPAQVTHNAVIARAIHGDNWNPEPQALPVFAAWMREHGVAVKIRDVPLSRVHDSRPRADLVLVSGIETHEFTDAERDALRTFVGDGGTVLFETPGGGGDFTLSAERMAAKVFGVRVDPLLRERVVSGRGLPGGHNLTRVEYRPYSFEIFGGVEESLRLRGATIDGRTCLFFSREDISHGLLDQPCWGIHGYAPRWARRLLANIVLHAMTGTDGS
ncbi:MAG: DUF4159 domain-containing protein [Planctomycetes bacterium]|nr:DUF4159 domain-containing protein [Planctomycetota bacterium]